MRVNGFELVVIMSVWMLIIKLAVKCAVRVVSIIHACSEIGIVENFILMVKPESMPNFLADDKLPPCRSVIFRGIKICVIHLGNTLSNMAAAHPNLGQS